MPEPVHLVTGATGLIGGAVARRLVAEGCRVRALVRPASDVAGLQEIGVELAVGDLRDAAAVQCATRGAALVYHLGAVVTDWAPRRQFVEINIRGTQHVVQAAVAEHVQRLVFVSSASVYGYPRMSQPVDEQHPQRSRGIPYIRSKIAAEQIVWQAHRQHQLNTAILRPVMVFGPGCQNYVGEVVRHLRRGSMLLFDGGRHVAGLAYVQNVVDALLAAARTPEANGRAFNIWDDSEVTWREYLDALADGVGAPRPTRSLPTRVVHAAAIASEAAAGLLRLRRRPWLTRLAVLELGQPQRYDIALARQVLGYTPRTNFEDAMRATTAWARQQR